MIGIIVAHNAEARPLIQHYRLRAVSGISGFRAHANERVLLLQCGQGKVAAAAAVAYAQGWQSNHSLRANAMTGKSIRGWLNVGIAGHRSLPLGERVIAHKVIDHGSGQYWYPALVFQPSCKSLSITTVDAPQRNYPQDTAYDMEASGFFAAASRFTSAELITIVKVISDNRERGWSDVTRDLAADLLRAALSDIDDVLTKQEALAGEIAELEADPPCFAEIIAHFHVTQSQRHQLRRALQRFAAAGRDELPPLHEFKNVNGLLAWLRHRLVAGMTRYRLG